MLQNIKKWGRLPHFLRVFRENSAKMSLFAVAVLIFLPAATGARIVASRLLDLWCVQCFALGVPGQVVYGLYRWDPEGEGGLSADIGHGEVACADDIHADEHISSVTEIVSRNR